MAAFLDRCRRRLGREKVMITVLGSANMDLIASVQRLPKPGETVLGSALVRAPGGKGANQAVAAARAGGDVVFVGRVGDDENGGLLVHELKAAGVRTDLVTVDAANATGLALIAVDSDGENMIVVLPGANGAVSIMDVRSAQDFMAAGGYLLTQLEIPVPTATAAIEAAAATGVRVILNAAPAQPLGRDILKDVDVLVANEREIAMLSGVGSPFDPVASAQMLLETGVKSVVLTLGVEGAIVVMPDQGEIEIPAFPVRPVDTTGAGDTFVGNLAYALDSGQSLADAARFASAAAALSVETVGAQPSMPFLSATEALLRGDRQ
jgi:ribokinase